MEPSPASSDIKFSPYLSSKINFYYNFQCAVLSCSVASDSATPWTVACQDPLCGDSPGKNTGVGCHFLLQPSENWSCWVTDGKGFQWNCFHPSVSICPALWSGYLWVPECPGSVCGNRPKRDHTSIPALGKCGPVGSFKTHLPYPRRERLGENGCMYIHGWVPSLFTRNYHIVC